MLLALAPAALAQTTSCKNNRYFAVDPTAFPGVEHIRAINLPRLTTGYAPRCLVAESIGGDIQYFFSQHSRFPRSLEIHGARWDAGTWRLRYTRRQFASGAQYRHAVASHGRQRVTMDLTS